MNSDNLIKLIKDVEDYVQNIGESIVEDYKIKSSEVINDKNDKGHFVLLNEFNKANTTYLNRSKELSEKRLQIIYTSQKISQDALSLLQTINYLDLNYYSILKKIQEIDRESAELLKIASLIMRAKISIESNHVVGSINAWFIYKLL